MYWIIFGIAVVLTILSAVLWFCCADNWQNVGEWIGKFATVIFGIFALAELIVCICFPIRYRTKMVAFQESKIAIELVLENEGALDSVALTHEIIRMNDWLVQAKAARQRWGNWSMYPKEVEDMEYIVRSNSK